MIDLNTLKPGDAVRITGTIRPGVRRYRVERMPATVGRIGAETIEVCPEDAAWPGLPPDQTVSRWFLASDVEDIEIVPNVGTAG